FIAREKVALTAVPVDTPVAPSAGLFAVTVGAALCVVNDQETAPASATPSAALTVAASVAVYVVPAASAAVGVNVAVFVVPLYETLAATAPAGPASVNPARRSSDPFIAREKVALAAVPIDTPVAPSAGDLAVTVGAALCVV